MNRFINLPFRVAVLLTSGMVVVGLTRTAVPAAADPNDPGPRYALWALATVGLEAPMKSMPATLTFVVATVCAVLLPVQVWADPIVVTRGTVAARTWDEMGVYFLAPLELGVLTTTGGLATAFYPPGASASLTNHIQVANVELVGAFNGPGSIDFTFTTGQVVQLPAAVPLETISNPFYAVYTPRFTFTGTALGYNSLGEIVFSRDFTGVGSSRFVFHGVVPMFAEREGFFLDDTIFNFDAGDPVPEPATLLMLVTGLGLFTAKRRIGMRVRPRIEPRAAAGASGVGGRTDGP